MRTCTRALDFFWISLIFSPPGPITSLTLLAGICRWSHGGGRHGRGSRVQKESRKKVGRCRQVYRCNTMCVSHRTPHAHIYWHFPLVLPVHIQSSYIHTCISRSGLASGSSSSDSSSSSLSEGSAVEGIAEGRALRGEGSGEQGKSSEKRIRGGKRSGSRKWADKEASRLLQPSHLLTAARPPSCPTPSHPPSSSERRKQPPPRPTPPDPTYLP